MRDLGGHRGRSLAKTIDWTLVFYYIVLILIGWVTLFEDIKTKQLALPSGEMVQKVHTNNASLQAELTLTKQKLKSAIIELERCSSGLFTKPNKAVIEDLKQSWEQ